MLVNAGSSAGSEDYTADWSRSWASCWCMAWPCGPGTPSFWASIQGKPVLGIPGLSRLGDADERAVCATAVWLGCWACSRRPDRVERPR